MSASTKFERVVTVLPPGVSARDVAERCRSAALELFEGSARGWRKHQLAAWLAGPYASLVVSGGRRRTAERPTRPITDLMLLRVMLRARRFVLREMRDGRSGWADACRARGWVVSAVDEDGVRCVLPCSVPGMRLGERLLSLFAASVLSELSEVVHVPVSVRRMVAAVALNHEVGRAVHGR
jgi:hypothetical protein